ncbi:MAG: VWA domain-containing protein [Actinomycetia bacterium]|nr:VWA domain-containing protein [Actinomycetes bacterium]
MQQDSALITFVLDESGSMGSIETEARQGFNDYLEDQIGHGGETWWTLTTFNQKARTRFAAIPGAEVRPLTEDYSPSGMTALYDAVGSSVTKTQAYLETLGGERSSDVIVVILTDGMENASQQWTDRQVFDLITEAEDSGWQFVFLGANQNSWDVSRRMGIRKGTVVDWAPTTDGHARAMEEANLTSKDFRRLKQQQVRYSDRRYR